MSPVLDTYKYWFKIGSLKVHCGVSSNLKKSEWCCKLSRRYTIHEGKRYYWKLGYIVQEGPPCSLQEAEEWEEKNKKLVIGNIE